MKIAMIGCGDVGQCYGRAFHQQGMNISDVFDIATTKEVSQLAESLNAQLHSEPGTWLAKADVVISAVFGAVAMQTFEKVAPYMKSNAIFADLTTAPVQDLNKAARQAQLHGVRFVDVALMGTVSLSGHRTPLFMAGQGGQALADLFQQIQAPVTVMDSPAGSAIALKLLRSVYTKGLEALAVECLIAAEKQGLTNDLFAALADVEKVKNSELMKTMVQNKEYH